jgi:hypothetical protein
MSYSTGRKKLADIAAGIAIAIFSFTLGVGNAIRSAISLSPCLS